MYKVFFNESFLIFASKDEKIDLGNSNILEIENFTQIESWLAKAESSEITGNIIYRSLEIKKIGKHS